MPEVNEEEMRRVDRELSQLLAVEPSPEFAAQVRTRIEQQPARAFAGWVWAMAPVAAAAVIVAAVIAVSHESAPVATPGVQAAADIHLPQPAPPTAAGQRLQVPSDVLTRGPKPVHHTAQTRRPPATSERVLIDPTLALAVRRLAVERPVLPNMPLEPSLDPVIVEPLKVSDIAALTGVRPEADR